VLELKERVGPVSGAPTRHGLRRPRRARRARLLAAGRRGARSPASTRR
jgi:hypothetical protein